MKKQTELKSPRESRFTYCDYECIVHGHHEPKEAECSINGRHMAIAHVSNAAVISLLSFVTVCGNSYGQLQVDVFLKINQYGQSLGFLSQILI